MFWKLKILFVDSGSDSDEVSIDEDDRSFTDSMVKDYLASILCVTV